MSDDLPHDCRDVDCVCGTATVLLDLVTAEQGQLIFRGECTGCYRKVELRFDVSRPAEPDEVKS